MQQQSRQKILVVDDDLRLRDLLKRYLSEQGFSVDTVPDAQAMERSLPPVRRMQWPFFYHVRSMLEQRVGHPEASLQDGERALALARELSLPLLQLPHFLARAAQARAATGDWDGALRAADEATALAPAFERAAFEQRRELLQIEVEFEAGETQRVSERLAAVLAGYRAKGQFVFMRSRPDLAARFVNFALQQGIETEFVHTLIERNALVAPADASADWPFRPSGSGITGAMAIGARALITSFQVFGMAVCMAFSS